MPDSAHNNWSPTTFGELSKRLVNGGTPPTEVANYWNGSIPWITGADFTPSGIGEFRRFVSMDAVRNTSTNVIDKGNLLLVTRTGVGKLAIAPCDIAISQDITGVYPDLDRVDTKFLFHRMRRGVEDLKKLNQGTSINGIIRDDLVHYAIQLPPIPQQKRIAEILTTVDEAIEQTEALIAKTQQIKAGLMHDLFTRGVTPDGQLRPPREEARQLYKETPLGWIPKEWEILAVEGLLDRIIDYRGKTPTKTTSGIRLITAKNVRMGYVDSEPREFIATSDYKLWMTRGIPMPSDILFTTEAPLGNVAQITTTDRVAFAQRVIILRPSANVSSGFLKYRLMCSDFQNGAIGKASGTTALGIKQSEFRKLLVSFPVEKSEQAAIEHFLTTTDARLQSELTTIRKLRAEKSGLMHDLLSGQVQAEIAVIDPGHGVVANG